MRLKHLIYIALIFTLSYSVESSDYPKSQMGLDFSTINGAGLGYQMEIDRHSALKLNGFAYYFGNNPPNDMDIYLNIGANYQWNIHKEFAHRVYYFLGSGIWYIERRNQEIEELPNDITEIKNKVEIDKIWNVGSGLGYEYNYIDVISMSIELGLQYQSSQISTLSSFIDRTPDGLSFIGIGGGVGFRFHF